MTVRLGKHEMLDVYQQSVLVVDAINRLPHRDDLLDGKTEDGCCPECCASCGILFDLAQDHLLDHIVLQAPVHFRKADWWDRDGEVVDRAWLDAAWNLYPCPHHTPLDGQTTDE